MAKKQKKIFSSDQSPSVFFSFNKAKNTLVTAHRPDIILTVSSTVFAFCLLFVCPPVNQFSCLCYSRGWYLLAVEAYGEVAR